MCPTQPESCLCLGCTSVLVPHIPNKWLVPSHSKQESTGSVGWRNHRYSSKEQNVPVAHVQGDCTVRPFSQQWLSPAFLFQMYIALISLHALIMVGFHFLHCFEEDWTSKYCWGFSSCCREGVETEWHGGLHPLCSTRPSLFLLDLPKAYRLIRL